jgi:hypothetical protein
MRGAVLVLALACASFGALSVSDDDWAEHDKEIVNGGTLVHELHAEGDEKPTISYLAVKSAMEATKKSHRAKSVDWCTNCLDIEVPKGYTSAQAVATAGSLKLAWIVYAAIFLVLGSFFCTFGVAMLTLSMALLAFLAGYIIFFFIGCGIMPAGGAAWGAVGIGVFCGVMLATLALCFRTVGHVCVGMCGGLLFALQLNGWILHFVWNAVGGEAAHYGPIIVNVALAFLGGALMCCECSKNHMFVLTTSFCGAFMMVWGSLQLVQTGIGSTTKDSLAVFMNPVVLFAGQREDGWQCYVGLACVLIVGLGACWLQFKHTMDMECFGGKLGTGLPKEGNPGYEETARYSALRRGQYEKDAI